MTTLQTNMQKACSIPTAYAWQQLADNNQIVDAIKHLRLHLNFGLKDAKDVVEEYRYSPNKAKYAIIANIALRDGRARLIMQNPDGTLTVIHEQRFDTYQAMLESLHDQDARIHS